MNDESARASSKARPKLWIAVIGAGGAAIAVVPPRVTAFRSTAGINQQGAGNTAISGSTLNSNNTTHNTFISMWEEGARTLVGAGPKTVVTCRRCLSAHQTALLAHS